MPSNEERDRIEDEDAKDSEPQRILHDCGHERTPDLRLLHFNDVYHPKYVQQRERSPQQSGL